MVCNTAIFYDIENLICLFTVKNNTILQLDEIYRRILEVEGVSGVSVQKAYADWAVQINRNLRNYVLQIGIEPVQIFNTNQNDKVKNAADVSLIIDAVELLAKRPDIENYVIVSGDGIFAFLAKKLHEHGKRVIGCGFNRNTNNIFRNSCDYFISLEKTDKTLTATSNKSTLTGPSQASLSALAAQAEEAAEQSPAEKAAPVASQPPVAPAKPQPAPAPVKPQPAPAPAPAPAKSQSASAPAKQSPQPKKVPKRFPRGKFSEALANSDMAVLKDSDDAHGALLLMRDMVNILFGNGADESADLEISVFKTYVDYYVQGFKVTQYKFQRFGEFVRFLLSGSPYCLYAASTEGNTLKIARRGTPGVKGSVMTDRRDLKVTLADGTVVDSIFDVPGQMAFTYSIADASKSKAKKQTKTPRGAKRDNEAASPSADTGTAESADASDAAAPVDATGASGTIALADATTPAGVNDKPSGAIPTDNEKSVLIIPTEKPGSAISMPAIFSQRVEVTPPVVSPLILTSEPPRQTEHTEKPSETESEDASPEGSIRKWIKSNFMRLSLENALSSTEVRRLTTVEYSQKTFGVKTPVFKESVTRSNLREQRMVNGKIKYWKESFKYNGKTYLVYKEWIASLHQERFAAWLKKIDPKQDRTGNE